MKHVAEHTKNLTPDEIRSSLKRCRVALDFPVPAEETIRRALGEPKPKKERTSGDRAEVTLADLIRAGLLQPPVQLEKLYKEKRLQAQIEADGSITFKGQRFDSLSQAAAAARASVLGTKDLPATNGWTFWKLHGAGGELVEVDTVRQAFGQQGKGEARKAA